MYATSIQTRSYRTETEDRATVFDHFEGKIVGVADGVGGRQGGGRAADVFVASLNRRAVNLRALHKASIWHLLLESVDGDIRADGGGGETTGVVLGLTDSGIAGAAVGDSEVWIVPDSPAPAIVLAGRGRRKPYLGYGMSFPEPFAVKSLQGTLLVATDGLFKYADADRIAAAARLPDLQSASNALADLPRPSEGIYHDDLALILCRRA